MNDKRDWKIYFEWIEGKDYKVLAPEFGLSEHTIKEICINKVPPHIRAKAWQRFNQYEAWRKWKKTHMRKNERPVYENEPVTR